MSSFVGTATLARFVLRRDRVRIPIWLLSLLGLVYVSAVSVKELYPDPAELAEYAATVRTNAAMIAMGGPAHGMEVLGGRIAWELWPFGVAVALMAVFAVGRHTRAEEESGRTELVRATVVGRHAHSMAALLVATASCLLLGLGIALALIASDLPAMGSFVLGAAFAAVGIVFAAVALLTAQLNEHSRAATGLAAGALGVSFVVRAIGDVSVGALSWLSPLGWMQATRPYAGDRWWPIAISLLFAALLVAVALAVEARRDLGAGLIVPRAGSPVADPSLGHPIGLAWRLQRGSLFGWSTGMFLGALAMGSVAHSADDLVGDNEAMLDYLRQLGGASLTDVFLATILVYLALLASGYGLQSAVRLRSEETAGRAEPLLATSLSRQAWTGGHLVMAFGGSAVLLAVGGAGAGLAHAIATGDAVELPRLVASSLAFVPAVWVLVGIAAALFGVVPRALPLVWAALAVCVVVVMLAEVLDLPQWVRALSPFDHVSAVPASAPRVLPLAVLGAIGAALASAGVAGFRRRDVTTV